MKRRVVSLPCRRVQDLLDESMAEGEMRPLPPELVAHVARCPRCAAEWQGTERLFARLRGAAAQADLGLVPGVVDGVLAAAVQDSVHLPKRLPTRTARERGHTRWVLGQVAAAVAVLAIAVGGLAFTALKLNQAVSGVDPGQVVERLSAPFRELSQAMFRNTR